MTNVSLLLFSHSVVLDSLWPDGLQHARLPCALLSSGVCSHSNPLRQWFYLTISASATRFFFCLQYFPMSQLFATGDQSIGALASASVFPVNIQGWYPLGLTSLISLLSKGLSRVSSNITVQKQQFFSAQSSLWSNSHICRWLLVKPLPRLYGPLLAKWCLCFLICCLGCPIL